MMQPAVTADLQLHVPVSNTFFCTTESSLFAFHFIKKCPHVEKAISLVKKIVIFALTGSCSHADNSR